MAMRAGRVLLWVGLFVGFLGSGHLLVSWGGGVHFISPWIGRGLMIVCVAGLVISGRRASRQVVVGPADQPQIRS